MITTAPIDMAAASIAAAIGEPARACMLYSLLDGHARTSSELAALAQVSPSTASVHLARLKDRRLVKMLRQGKHRYYSLDSTQVARALEALSVIAGANSAKFEPHTPSHLRCARTCYDHMAGRLAVLLRDRFEKLKYICADENSDDGFDVTEEGARAMAAMGIEIDAIRSWRRRFAYGCIDWSERRAHIGGALGKAILEATLQRKWFVRELDSRALRLTTLGRRQLELRFGLDAEMDG